MVEEIFMTEEMIKRLNVFSKVKDGRLSKTKAAEQLNLSFRQVQRAYARFQEEGNRGLVSKAKGRVSGNALPPLVRAQILELVEIELYAGFGPTFMSEKLKERHGIDVGRETVRKLMIEGGVWAVNNKKRPVVHQQRKRRACFGELMQIDGSPHAWFENRGEKCVLIVYIDDATGRTYGKFFESETTEAYMVVTREYITKHGRPLAFYSDRHSIFKVNAPNCLYEETLTQFGRAVEELGIKLLCARSPQAKGRVERANQTLQERLVYELRLEGVSTIEEANLFLERRRFWDSYNDKFSVKPESALDAHKEGISETEMDRILCLKEFRKVSRNLELSYKNVVYQLTCEPTRGLRGARVTVLEGLNGQILGIEYNGRSLPFRAHYEQHTNGTIVDSKEIDRFLNHKEVKRIINSYHPWLQEGRTKEKIRQYNSMRQAV